MSKIITVNDVTSRFSSRTREWLVELVFHAVQTANDSGHPCQEIARHLISEWALWRWTADGEVDGVVRVDHSKYDTSVHESSAAARRLANDHRSKRRVRGLKHHHVVTRREVTELLMGASSKAQIRKILKEQCRAKIVTADQHRKEH